MRAISFAAMASFTLAWATGAVASIRPYETDAIAQSGIDLETGVAQQSTQPAPVPAPPVLTPAPVAPAPVAPAETPPVTDKSQEQLPGQDTTNPDDPENVLPNLEGGEVDDFSVGEIPAVETVELTDDTARKSLDAYVLVREKYKDAELENYENLQDFVDGNSLGKAFEADIKSFGFATVNDWNIAITMVGFAYSNIVQDQSADIRAQIVEVEADTEMAQDMRDRMVAALKAMIPSDNNRKVVDGILKDPVYGEKLKQLESEDE